MTLALKPDDGETFLREVDDELRREQMNRFVKRYGWALIAAVVLVLAAIGGWIWWKERAAAAAEADGEALVAALESLEAGNRNVAAAQLNALAASDRPGYRAAALFARANSQTAAGNAPAAIATLRAIAANQEFDEAYRQAALIRQTQLEFDSLPPQQVVQRLRPLARPGGPWLGSAGEMLGVAYLKLHRPELAGQIFATVGRDESVPSSIRTRAIQMAGSLGIDAIDAPAAAAAAPARPVGPAQPAPPATREKAE